MTKTVIIEREDTIACPYCEKMSDMYVDDDKFYEYPLLMRCPECYNWFFISVGGVVKEKSYTVEHRADTRSQLWDVVVSGTKDYCLGVINGLLRRHPDKRWCYRITHTGLKVWPGDKERQLEEENKENGVVVSQKDFSSVMGLIDKVRVCIEDHDRALKNIARTMTSAMDSYQAYHGLFKDLYYQLHEFEKETDAGK